MSVTISFSELHVLVYVSEDEDCDDRQPVTYLPQAAEAEYEHIHGRLSIQIDGRELPHLGFFGPTDVCLNSWIAVFNQLLTQLSAAQQSRFVYDEMEQGQPAFEFVQEFDALYLSIIDSEGDGGADPEWQRVPCNFREFCEQVRKFLSDLKQTITKIAPEIVEQWWQNALAYC